MIYAAIDRHASKLNAEMKNALSFQAASPVALTRRSCNEPAQVERRTARTGCS
jgi:hypothetical protein